MRGKKRKYICISEVRDEAYNAQYRYNIKSTIDLITFIWEREKKDYVCIAGILRKTSRKNKSIWVKNK